MDKRGFYEDLLPDSPFITSKLSPKPQTPNPKPYSLQEMDLFRAPELIEQKKVFSSGASMEASCPTGLMGA